MIGLGLVSNHNSGDDGNDVIKINTDISASDDGTDGSHTSRDNNASNRTPCILENSYTSSSSGYGNRCRDCHRIPFHTSNGVRSV